MKIMQLHDNDEKKVVRVEASWSEIEADYRDIVSGYARMRLPGFRPGKVPQRVIEQRFQKEIIENLSDRIARRLGRQALREAGDEALGPLEVSEIRCGRGDPFRAVVQYLPLPDFRLPDLADLKGRNDGPDARDLISRRLLDLVTFEVPGELVLRELDLDCAGECDPAGEPWRAAAERIRLMIILKKIARQEGIEVDESDVSKRIAEKAEEWGESEGTLRSELEEGCGMDRLRDMLLAERTLQYLAEPE
jgi:FKBP-type peptidyl-prolyl cis-trans isomerase (trigger factor)